jgi:hypothetical protein
MPVSSTTVLDQIARFFILLSDAPSNWFTINASCHHAFQLSKRLDINEDNYKTQSTNNGDPRGCDGRWRGEQGRSRERGKRAAVMTATKPIPLTKPVGRHGNEMTMARP